MEEEHLPQRHEVGDAAAESAAAASSSEGNRFCGAFLPKNMRWAAKKPSAVSGTTFSFFFVLIFLATVVATRWADISSFAGTSFNRTISLFRRPANYPHIEEHLLNCTATNMTLTCPANYYSEAPITGSSNGVNAPAPAAPTGQTCPDYFRWIHEDLRPWKREGITREMVEQSVQYAHFRLTIVNGTAYVKRYRKAFQTRDSFTLWGVLQLLKMYPGRLPDLDMTFQCHDQPSILKSKHRAEKAPPLFHFCGSDSTYDIVFPDWSFWGWPEINIKPWDSLRKDLEEGNKMMKWIDRKPYAYWKGNLNTGARKVMKDCNSTEKWNAEIYQMDWGKEIREGFKNSDMSKQCAHRYKIYMEGNAWSVSEKYILACDSMALLVNPTFYDFFTRSLIPMTHYWPINPKHICKSVRFAVDWANNHTKAAQEIGSTGSKFIREEVRMEHVYDYMFHVLSGYGNLLRYRPTVVPGSVELCSEGWVCSKKGLEKAYKIETAVRGVAGRRPCELLPPYDQEELKGIKGRKEKFLNLVSKAESGRI